MLNVAAVCERLNCSPQTVYALIRSGRLPASRRLANPRGAWLVTPEALEIFERQAQQPRQPCPVCVFGEPTDHTCDEGQQQRHHIEMVAA